MRGIATGGNDQRLAPNNSDQEFSTNMVDLLATGFQLQNNTVVNNSGNTYIYIAIRRPMKTPESGTEVFNVTEQAGGSFVTTGWPVDLLWNKYGTTITGQPFWWVDRLRGAGYKFLRSDGTDLEDSYATNYFPMDYNTGVEDNWNSSDNQFYYMFKRAPGFMDVVAYTGDGVQGTDIPHNLAVTPEMMIVKRRNSTSDWGVYHSASGATKFFRLQSNIAELDSEYWWADTAPTASVFTVGLSANNGSGTYIAYLFATLAGVSKVGSYTGNGTSQTIDCGFSGGARFILIKRTDSTGDWYVWDSTRGIVTGNDPHLSLNTTAAEITTDDSIDPDSSGFIVNQDSATNINVSSASYIYLSIA
jgi:hypothetical protein